MSDDRVTLTLSLPAALVTVLPDVAMIEFEEDDRPEGLDASGEELLRLSEETLANMSPDKVKFSPGVALTLVGDNIREEVISAVFRHVVVALIASQAERG